MADVIEDLPPRTPTVELLKQLAGQLEAMGVKTVPPALGELALRVAALERDRDLLERLAQRDLVTIGSVRGEPTITWKRSGAGPSVAALSLRALLRKLPPVPR